jgi:hypothetical protein
VIVPLVPLPIEPLPIEPLPIEPVPIEPLPIAPLPVPVRPVIESVLPPSVEPASTPPVVPMREESFARLPEGARLGSAELMVPAVPGTGVLISGPRPLVPGLMPPGIVVCADATFENASATAPATTSFFNMADLPSNLKSPRVWQTAQVWDANRVPLAQLVFFSA